LTLAVVDMVRSATLPNCGILGVECDGRATNLDQHNSGSLDSVWSISNNQNLISNKTRASRTKIAIAEIKMIVLERDFLISTLVVPVAVSKVLLIL